MSMLKDAVLDADELKRASTVHAQKLISERYNDKIKKAIEKILLEDDSASNKDDDSEGDLDFSGLDETLNDKDEPADLTEETSVSTGNVDAGVKANLPNAHKSNDDRVEIDLQKLEEMILRELEDSSNFDITDKQTERTEVIQEVQDQLKTDDKPKDETVTESVEEEKLNETLEVAACTNNAECNCEKCKQNNKINELNEQVEELKESIKRYQSKLGETREIFKKETETKEKYKNRLIEQTLSNSKLIYQNRVLLDESLTTNQKKVLVENIAKADTSEKAKTIYELRKTSTAAGNKSPKSLQETLGRSTMSVNGSQKEETDPAFKRMQELTFTRYKKES